MIGFAFFLPLMAGAAAPDISISSIVATPQTNYNGSAVMATFTGSLDDYTVALKVGSSSYAGTVSGGTMTFFVPGNVAAASNIYASTIVATEKTGDKKSYTLGAKYLYQGAPVAGTPTVWFTESPTLEQHGGSWSPSPTVEGGKYVFDDEADEWAEGWKTFTPTVEQKGQAATLVMDISFDYANDNYVCDVSDVQASVRLVTVGEEYRFAYLDGGGWKTNVDYQAFLNTNYTVRMEFNYRIYPATVSYYVKTGTVDTLLKAGAVAGGNKLAIESVSFNGCGKLAQMTGSNVVDTVDASLVQAGDTTKWANPDAVPADKRNNLTLLWDTAWTPNANTAGEWTIHKGGKNLYISENTPGVRVTKDGTDYTVIANYYELQKAGDDTVKYMYLDNALADTAVSSFKLLRDLTASDLTLPRDLTFDFNNKAFVTGTVALDVHTLTVAGSAAAAVPFDVLTGTGTLTDNATAALLLKNVSGFEGSLNVAAGAGGVTIGSAAAADNAGKITLAAGAAATIASGKSWTAASGIAINGSLGGAGTLASATTFGNAATLTSGALTASVEPIFGDALNVTIQGAASGSTILSVPQMTAPTTAVTANGESGYTLLCKSGKLQLYKQAPLVFTVTAVTSTAQTNYNGSAVVVTYTGFTKGSYENVTAKLSVNGHEYVYGGTISPGSGTLTFNVASDVVTAGELDKAVITVTGTEASAGTQSTAYNGAKYLYQGTATNLTTNVWFAASATGSTLNESGGAWAQTKPVAADGKIRFPEDDETGELIEYVFAPTAAQAGQVVVVEADMVFEAALDSVPFETDALQGAVRVVSVNDVNRFAAIVGGVWVTNTTEVVSLAETITIRTTFDYRNCPSTVKYELKKGDAYVVIANGVSRTDKAALASASFAGEGALVSMTGKECASLLDASLVEGSNGKHYATPSDALNAGVTNLTLLWNTAWQPTTGAGAFTISKGVYSWYYAPKDGLLVRENPDGSLSVVTDYWEVMNLLGGEETTYMYFTNAVISGGTTVSNLYLLRDVVLGETLTVDHDIWFNGESNILSGAGLTVGKDKTFTIVGGCIGILGKDCGGEGKVALTGGRYKTTPGWDEPTDYTFADLAFAVREGYTKQLMKSDDAPKTGQELLPVKDANGESVSVVVNTSWAADVTGKSTAAEQSAALSEVQTNGMTRLDNEILGLTKAGGAVATNNIPVIQPVQSSSTTQIKFSLGNVNKDTISASGAKVTYRVVTSSKPGGKDGAVSSYVAPSAEVQMDLPSSGVQYYIIEVDTGAVK